MFVCVCMLASMSDGCLYLVCMCVCARVMSFGAEVWRKTAEPDLSPWDSIAEALSVVNR